MLMENIRIGLPFIADQSELEATVKIAALTKAVSSLPVEERPLLFLVVTDETLTPLSFPPPYISLFDGIIYMGRHLETAAVTFGTPLIHTTSYDRLLAKIDFCFTVYPQVLPHPRTAVWIPDFRLPDFSQSFLPQEHAWHDTQLKQTSEQASMIIFTRHTTGQDFLKVYPAAKGITKVIAAPFYPEREWYDGDPGAVQHKYGLPDKFILCSNHFWRHKNHPELFRAIALLRQLGQDVHLVCSGLTNDPQLPDYFLNLQQYIRHINIDDLIHILGPIPDQDNIALLRRSLFVVQPSLGEGLNIIIQQCRALAKSIILSDINIHWEENYGTYFHRDDYEDLAEKIALLLPQSAPGPDLKREAEAKQAGGNLAQAFARQFCNIVFQVLEGQTAQSSPSQNNEPCRPVQPNAVIDTAAPFIPVTLDNWQQPYPAGGSKAEVITIATSLAPRDFDNQRGAVRSWKNLGFEVVSINAPAEIALLKPHFPDIEFVTANRDAEEKYGKPYIYLDDFLTFFKNRGCKVCGIINSDILLNKENFHSIIYNEANDALVYGPRVNIDSFDLTQQQGTMEPHGFDYFFFDKALIPCFPREEFCVGLPFWDYWLPLVAAACEFTVKKIITPVAYHVKHPARWDWESWTLFARILAKYLPLPTDPSDSVHSLHLWGKMWHKVITKHSIEIRI
ncbi:MAG TPA: glycosyltransferase [Methylomusa anaerophila]|uniref:Glycosyl transferases group 1 n=1 Tax=Methylomusa anaerophila TaxID=1930071 RepID=A0A348AG86_9FIRM|nr:glycosyltransferase [Methylomusa anaerophila]BBB90084.1 glycosyl transferases group 1 [Methylomusa anaerophila]HML88191.1 glycosyltransferase [Methylomusa anaerophila]